MGQEARQQAPSERRNSPAKKNSKKNRNSSQPQLKEPWRKSPAARTALGSVGMEKLQGYLNEEIRVVPQSTGEDLPVLSVTPAELIRHVLATLASTSQSIKAANAVFVEVYGGVAQTVVAEDAGCAEVASTPTDFDARFYIPKGNGDGREFDMVRYIVEDYLLMKLRLAVPAESELRNADPSVVRFGYYQKQCMIAGTFSLLSIGDPETGKALDLEFSCNNGKARKYFDEANSFVIPLTLQQLAGVTTVHAMTMTGSYSQALELMQRRELLVREPEEVMNGLALFAHAISDKGLRPASLQSELSFGQCMAKSFLETTAALQSRYEDPLRFVRSFLRSHYTARPISALATIAQLAAELGAHSDAEALGDESDPNSVLSLLADLLSGLFLQAIQVSNGSSADLLAILQVACFVRLPGSALAEHAREVLLQGQSGREIRLLRKTASGDCYSAVRLATSKKLQELMDEDDDTWNVQFEALICKLLSDSVEIQNCLVKGEDKTMRLFAQYRSHLAEHESGGAEHQLLLTSSVMAAVSGFRNDGEQPLAEALSSEFLGCHAKELQEAAAAEACKDVDLSEVLKDQNTAHTSSLTETSTHALEFGQHTNVLYWGGDERKDSGTCINNCINEHQKGLASSMKRAIQLLESYAEERNEEMEREDWEKGMYPFCCRPDSGGGDDGPSNDPSGSPTTIQMSPSSPRATLWRLRRAMLQQAG